GVDEAKVRDDGALRGQPERGLRGCGVARMEPLEVDGVRDHRRADAEDVRDVVVDRDRRCRQTADRASYEPGAAIGTAFGERGAKVPDDGEPLPPRQPRGRNQRRVVEVDEFEAVPAEGPAELP